MMEGLLMNKLISVLGFLVAVFTGLAFAADETVSFTGSVVTGCAFDSIYTSSGAFYQESATTLASDFSGHVYLNCSDSATVSISDPSEETGTLDDDDFSLCTFEDYDYFIFSGDSNNSSLTGGAYSGQIAVGMFWSNTVEIPDGSYTINCTITATPS